MKRAKVTLAVLALATSSGCGWHAGLVAPDGVRSIAVEVVITDRSVLERGFEEEFTDALSRAVSDLVDAPIVAPDRADAIVRGKILEFRRRTGVRSTENQLVETGLLLRIEAQVIDGHTGAVLRETAGPAHVWSGYALGADAVQNEAGARERALRHLADTLVLDLFGSEARPEAAPATHGAASDAGADEIDGDGRTARRTAPF